MQFTCKTVALHGVDARPVEVQCQVARGLHQLNIVGLPDKAVRESKERISAAFYANSIALPPMKILFNLSPADIPKFGNHYDLPMAIALLVNLELLPSDEISRFFAMGALALDGKIEPVNGVLATAIEAKAQESGLICPIDNASEAELVGEIALLAPPTLLSLIKHFKGKPITMQSNRHKAIAAPIFRTDMSLIKGLEMPRRALEIAAAGRHHLFMVGPPGAGKSLLSSAIPSIMPPMNAAEILETTLVHSAAGLVKQDGPVLNRPYYDPHHTASAAAIVGGGQGAGPGEISLAHHGVLFLDELPEFKRDVLESLRQPLETGEILIARANAHLSYPAKFLLVAAANPCNCGMMFEPSTACNRAPLCGEKYMERLSGPLLDRFSLRIMVPATDAISLGKLQEGESSEKVRNRVMSARKMQYARNGNSICNEDLDSGALDAQMRQSGSGAQAVLEKASQRFSLSPRGYYRMIKTARTIADLSGAEVITAEHIAETALYRMMEGSRLNYDVNKRLASV